MGKTGAPQVHAIFETTADTPFVALANGAGDVPERFTFEMDDDEAAVTVRIDVQVFDGRPECVGLTAFPISGGHVPDDYLRRLALRSSVRAAAELEALNRRAIDEGIFEAVPVLPQDERTLAAYRAAGRRYRHLLTELRPKRPSASVIAEQVKQAAVVYRRALKDGRPDPTMAVTHTLNISRATASRRIDAAREAGLLGPVLGTKGGEGPLPSRARKGRQRDSSGDAR